MLIQNTQAGRDSRPSDRYLLPLVVFFSQVACVIVYCRGALGCISIAPLAQQLTFQTEFTPRRDTGEFRDENGFKKALDGWKLCCL